MIKSFWLAFCQLSDPRLRRIVLWGVAGALLSWLLVSGTAWLVLSQITFFQEYWANLGAVVTLGLVGFLMPLLFFPAVATTIMSVVLDKVAAAVEERYYPNIPPARQQSLREILRISLRFLGVTLLVNLLALPIYILLLFTGLTFVAVVAVNGYLLGREYYETVALRHLDPETARLLMRRKLGSVWLTGVITAILFSVPLLNLVVPVVGTAAMTHRYQALRQSLPPGMGSPPSRG